MTRRNHISFLFYQVAGHIALFFFGVIFTIAFLFDDKDITTNALRQWWEIIWAR